MLICVRCHETAYNPKTHTPGSLGMEIALWLFFLVPGVIYSVWRLSARAKVCPSCGSGELIPLESPRGKQIQESSKSS
jgi:hypothetical protein